MREPDAQVLRIVGREAGILALPATPGSPERRAPDVTKVPALTGYQARVGLAAGLRRTYAWYQENVFAGAGVRDA